MRRDWGGGREKGQPSRENSVSQVGTCGAKNGTLKMQNAGQVSSDGEGKNEMGPPLGSSPQKEDHVGVGPRVLREHRVGGI